jgi:hypothetical protein
MSLALRCGLPHFDYLLPFLSASQLRDVVALHQHHNLSFDRDDYFWSNYMAMYFNAHKPEKEWSKKPEDFIPWAEKKPLTVEELRIKMGFAK